MKEKWIGSRGRTISKQQRDGRAWPMADGETGEAGKTGELTGKHLAFKLGPAFILWSVGSC